ncbi:MAG: molybdopterin molybdotransferase MoeA [Acidimicrobiales bacterium]|nr:molybdopterin molybdotransferase MoeA [Acidimicrobiales bacterium]
MIPLDEALAHVLERVAPLAPRRVELTKSAGLVLAEAITAPEDVPAFANTAMDGYAVVAADTAGAAAETPVRLPVVGEIAAGHPAQRPLRPGEAMRIFTGAPMPDGADAVVMVERTERLDGGATVAVLVEVASGLHVRSAGDDLRAGDAVFAPGEVVSPGHLGVLAGIGAVDVLVHPRPRVGVLSTGDELVPPGRPLEPGQIRDSNRIALLALVARSGFEPVDLGLVRDDETTIAGAISEGAATCDAVLTSGGVSMGDIDLVRVVLDRLGDMRWMQIAIRPAKPFAFGVVGERATPVFGLPGNPVSSMVSFELLARPALRRRAGRTDLLRVETPGVAGEAFRRSPDGKVHYVRVVVERGAGGPLVVRSAGAQGSHHLTAMARADGLAVLPDGDGLAEGDEVHVLLLASDL